MTNQDGIQSRSGKIVSTEDDLISIQWDNEDVGFEVGDRVVHVKDPTWVGVVREIDDSGDAFLIEWDDGSGIEPQWTNKYELLEEKLDFIGG